MLGHIHFNKTNNYVYLVTKVLKCIDLSFSFRFNYTQSLHSYNLSNTNHVDKAVNHK